MKNCIPFLLVLFTFFSCRKDTASVGCPINYKLDTNVNYSLTSKTWQLIGFVESNSDELDYPPCEGYSTGLNGKTNPDFRLDISFDGPHYFNNPETYEYPNWVGGHGAINSFGATYDIDASNNLMFSFSYITEMASTIPELNDYESKYFTALQAMNRFEINHNLLTIYYSGTDKMMFVALE